MKLFLIMYLVCVSLFLTSCGLVDEAIINEFLPSSSSSSGSSTGGTTAKTVEDPELAFAIAWLEILLPLQREPLSFEDSTLLFLAEPSSVLTRGNYVLLLNNRKNIYENLGNLEPPENMVSVYKPFALACLDLSEDMESLRNIVANVLIDVETESGFYKFGTNYLPVSEKIDALDQLAIPVMNYLESKYSNEYIMEQAPHLFE